MEKEPKIENQLAKLRQARGISAAHLAEVIGVSRQTIHAMEAGRYVPNTVVALRLARALETTVEDLFRLPDDPVAEPPVQQVSLLPGNGAVLHGQPVQVGRVGKRLIASAPTPESWYLPVGDGIVKTSAAEKASVRLFAPEESLENRIIVAGCDPGISVLARHARAAGIDLILAHRNSSQSLQLLDDGCIHIAGSHLKDEDSGESNLPQIQRLFPAKSVAIVSFAWWEEGFVVSPGNPRNIRTIQDLARPGVTVVNREQGAGARLLLDHQLAAAKMDPKQIRGYGTDASGHLQAAWRVYAGEVDCCIATRSAAQRFGLGFVPLARERYDFILRRRDLELPAIQTLFDILNRAAFRKELAALGYETGVSGSRIL